MHVEEKSLKRFITDSGLIQKEELEKAEEQAKKQKTGIGEILVSEGKLTEDDLRRIMAYLLGIPFVNLKDQPVDSATLSIIPEPIARAHNMVAFRKSDNALEVAMLDTDDLASIDSIKKKTGMKILPRLTDTQSIKNILRQYQKSLRAEFGEIIKQGAATLEKIKISAEGENKPGKETAEQDLKKLAEDLPVVRIVDTLLKHAVLQNASDIHIEPIENQLVVRYRIDGILRDAMALPKTAQESVVARIKVLSRLKIDEKRLPQDGRFKAEMESQKVSVRVSVLPTYFGEKVVMRVLKENGHGFNLEGMGLHGHALEQMHNALKQATGMILTTGPTGSGKTTTLYTLLDLLNSPEVNISTIEDPIEYQMVRVNQTQVKPEIGLTFANGLRALVRQDPDIIMVGEIRDNETASLAINASLTGHLVLSTLHTNSAAGAIPRLVDMKIEPFLIVSTLKIIVAQRLVRKTTKMHEQYALPEGELTRLREHVDLDKVMKCLKEEKVVPKDAKWETIQFCRPQQAKETEEYSGRIGIYEVLPVSSVIKELIVSGATSDDVEKQARKDGMMTMFEDGIFKAVQGLTTLEEVLRVISE